MHQNPHAEVLRRVRMGAPAIFRITRIAVQAAVTAVLSLALCASASAQKTIHVPADQPTIQSGIDASTTGDTVLVAPGTYFENIDFHGHNINVTSEQGLTRTALDGGRLASTVKFTAGEGRSAILSGFTIRNGQPAHGAQIGGGVYIFGASPTLLNNLLEDNYCSGIAVQQGGPLLRANQITRTHGAAGCTYPGTAITLYGSPQGGISALIDTNTLYGNLEETYGALLVNNSEDGVIQNNIIRDNVAPVSTCAAGVCIINTLAVTLFGNEFVNNTTGSSVRSLYAGILALNTSIESDQLHFGAFQLRLLNNTFVNRAVANTNIIEVLLDGVNARTLFLNNNIMTSSGNGLMCTNKYGPVDGPPIVEYNSVSSPQIAVAPACGNYNVGNVPSNLYQDAQGNYTPVNPEDLGNNSVLPQPALDPYGHARVQSDTASARIDRGAFEAGGNISVPQSKLVIEPSRFETGAGQPLVINAGLINSGPLDANGMTLDLYLDDVVMQQVQIASPGVAQFAPLVLTPGVHEIHASTHFITPTIPATESVRIRVNGTTAASTAAKGTLTLLADPSVVAEGSSVTLTLALADHTALDYGAVRVFDNGILLPGAQGLPLQNNTTFRYSLQPSSGEHLLTADYQGSFASSAVATIRTATTAAPAYTLTSQPSPADFSQAVVIGGSITPYDGTGAASLRITQGASVLLISPLDNNGAASISTATLAPGLHTFTGIFSLAGAPVATQTVMQTIRPAATQLTLLASPTSATVGSTVTLTAAVTSTYTGIAITGNIVFQDGAAVLGTAPLTGGSATLNVSNLAVGTHGITAVSAGNDTFQAGTSAAVSVVITPPPDFILTPATPSMTLATQHHGDVVLSLSSVGGFSGPVSLSCGPLPAVATCAFSASSYLLRPGTSTPVRLTIETSAVQGYLSQRTSPGGARTTSAQTLRCILPLPLLLLLLRRKRRHAQSALLALAAVFLAGLGGCSGKYPDATPPGTYTITVTAVTQGSSPILTHTAPLTLTITP